MKRTNCPDCGGDLGRNAYKCSCGWKASIEEDKPAIDLEAMYRRFREKSMGAWIAANKPSAEDSIELIRAYRKSPKGSPRAHWERVLNTKGLPLISYEYATAALKKSSVEPAEWPDRKTLAAGL